MLRWKPFRYDGILYDLSHLHPRVVVFNQPASGDKPEHTYAVSVAFGLHCFTRRIRTWENPDLALVYEDSREGRIFDFRRYKLSKSLPNIVECLLLRKCYHADRGNFFTVELLDGDGKIVFFVVSSGKGGMRLFVQSAYVKDSPNGFDKRGRKPVRFSLILYNTLNHRALHPA